MFKGVVGGSSFDLETDFDDFRAYLDEQKWFKKIRVKNIYSSRRSIHFFLRVRKILGIFSRFSRISLMTYDDCNVTIFETTILSS